jgi:hypothetical protein
MIWKITTDDTNIPSTAPHVILVKFDKLSDKSPVLIKINKRHYIPIFLISREFKINS